MKQFSVAWKQALQPVCLSGLETGSSTSLSTVLADLHVSRATRVCVQLSLGTTAGHGLESLAFQQYVRMPSLAVGTRISHSPLGDGLPLGSFRKKKKGKLGDGLPRGWTSSRKKCPLFHEIQKRGRRRAVGIADGNGNGLPGDHLPKSA